MSCIALETAIFAPGLNAAEPISTAPATGELVTICSRRPWCPYMFAGGDAGVDERLAVAVAPDLCVKFNCIACA